MLKSVLSITLLLLAAQPTLGEEVRVWNSSPYDAALFQIESLGGPMRIEPGQELVFNHPDAMVSLVGPPSVSAMSRRADGTWLDAQRIETNATAFARRRAVRSGPVAAATRVRVGDTAVFSGSHRVSGMATIVNANTIRVSNYRHDGTAPGLDMRLGLSTGARRDFTVIRITGNAPFNGDTVDVTLPAGMDLNSFDTFTVWCYVFKVVIADAQFRTP